MENRDSIKLLKECDAGSKMAVSSLEDILDKVENVHLKKLLHETKEHHEKLGNEIHSLLMKYGSEEKDPNPMAKSMSKMKSNFMMGMKEDSDETAADLITDGCNMGIKSLYKYMNQYPNADKKVKDLCTRLISIEDQLRKELKLIAQEQIHVSDRIISRYRSKKADENDVIRIFYALDSLADEYGDRDGFIDWRHGFDYVHGFESCLDDMVQPLIDQQEYMIAFKALDKAFYVLNHAEMDGSGGEHGEIEDVIKDYWMQIIPLASPEEQDQMHDWFMDMYQNDHDLITTEAIEEVLENSFDDLKYVLPLLENVRNQLNDPQTEGYKLSGLLEKYPNLLKRSGKSTKEYEQWLNEHSDLETVKRIRLEQAKTKNDFPAMIAILEDMASAERIEWRRRDFQDKLLELYQKTGDKEKEKDLLETLLLQHNVQSVKYLRRLRDLYNKKQWNTLRELYLSQHPDLKPEIYFEEKLYDRLMDSLKEKGYGIYFLSNMSEHVKASNRAAFDFVSHMDGGVWSCDVHTIKPDTDIYKILFEKYGLVPEECIFIDDHKENLDVAKKLGMKGIVFRDHDQLIADLDKALTKDASHDRITVLCYGDSNTYGYDPETCGRYPYEKRWTTLLGGMLGSRYEVISEGLNGRTTAYDRQGAAWKNGASSFIACLGTHKPVDYVIIMLGTNDCDEELGLSAVDIADGMETLVRMVEEETPALQGYVPEIIVAAPAAIQGDIEKSPFADKLTDESVKNSLEIGPLYRKIAEWHGVRFADATSGIEISQDCEHLTEEGHRQIAGLFFGTIMSRP